LEEIVGLQPESKKRQTQDYVPVQRQGVLSERVRDNVLRPSVLDAVHLYDQSILRPVEVEVVATMTILAEYLSLGAREAAVGQFSAQIQLAQAVSTAKQVADDVVKESAPPIAPDSQKLAANVLSSRDSLLHHHREQQRSLSVTCRPQSSPNRSDRRIRPRNARLDDVSCTPTTGLTDIEAARSTNPRAARNRHPDAVAFESLEPRRHQRRGAIEMSPRAALEDGGPHVAREAQLRVVKDDRLITDRLPTPRSDLSTDEASGDPDRVELPARTDATLLGRDSDSPQTRFRKPDLGHPPTNNHADQSPEASSADERATGLPVYKRGVHGGGLSDVIRREFQGAPPV
jgi:hypothetical protein